MSSRLKQAEDEGYKDEVTKYLDATALRAERGLAVARLVAVTLAAVRELAIVDGWNGLLTGEVHVWFDVSVYLAAGSFSVWSLTAGRRPDGLMSRLYASVMLDALLFSVLLVGAVLWPHDDYSGFLRDPSHAALYLTTIAAGFRLSRRVARLGIACNVAAMAGLIALDQILNPESIQYGNADRVMGGIILLVSCVLAYAIASGTRRLVFSVVDGVMRVARARTRFSAYVPAGVAANVMDTDRLKTGGERKDVAVLFSDLRGFTTYSENLDPRELVAELNAYLDTMVQVIQSHGGVVDKFIGDAIMVVFGISSPGPNDAMRGIQTMVAMQEALNEHNRERELQGRPCFQQGLGLHYGEVVVGNIGNAERLQFTVVGDSVNVASRLESATKALHVSTLISKSAVDAARGSAMDLPPLMSHGEIDVKGRVGSIEVFSIADHAR